MHYSEVQALVRRLAEEDGLTLPEDVVAFIADVVPRDARELGAAVLFVANSAALAHEPISMDTARRVLADVRWRERFARLTAVTAFCAGFSERVVENPVGFRSFHDEMWISGRLVAVRLPFPGGPRDGRRGACWVMRARGDDGFSREHYWDVEWIADSMSDGWFVSRAHRPSRDPDEVAGWADVERR
jgi:hypothetical protein